MIAAPTARTSAYVSALNERELVPERTLALGSGTAGMASWARDEIDVDHVRDDRVAAWLEAQSPRLVIYSGFGGQLVPASHLRIAPFLHVHAVRLPDYRGSTTLHFMVLNEGRCAASAILLEPAIDTGRVVLARSYPLPPAGVTLDECDATIRADLLVRVLAAGPGAIATATAQPREGAETWYVIHPVLKWIAARRAGARTRRAPLGTTAPRDRDR